MSSEGKTKDGQMSTIFEKALTAFGISKKIETNPEIIKEIIKEFKLDDFTTENERIASLFVEITKKPQSLAYLLDGVENGLLSKHPAVVEFTELALKKDWFKPSRKCIYALHVMYILEILTATMCNSHDFFVEVHSHYKKKEKKLGIDTRRIIRTFIHALKISPKFFDIAKPFSLDPFLVYFTIQRGLKNIPLTREELQKMYERKEINFFEYKLLLPIQRNHTEHINELVRINIYEAGVTDYNNGFQTNSISAHALSEDLLMNPPKAIFKKKVIIPENTKDPFYKGIIDEQNMFPTVAVSQKWASLYISWNMAFCLGNLNDLDIILPKLLIPSIVNAESENFLGARIISLWLTINHVIYRKSKKREILGPDNTREMAEAWARINKKYAYDLAKQEIHENSKVLMNKYKSFFKHSFISFFKMSALFLNGK